MNLLLRHASRQHQKCFSALKVPIGLVPDIMHNPLCRITLPHVAQRTRTFHHTTPVSDRSETSTVGDASKEDVVNSIKLQLQDARKKRNHGIMIQSYRRALFHGVELDLARSINIFHSYKYVQKSPLFNFDDVMNLYETIRDKKCFNYQVFMDMLTMCRHQNNHQLILLVNSHYEAQNIHNEKSMSVIISSLAETNAVSQTMKFYKNYRSYMPDNTALNAKNAAAYNAKIQSNDGDSSDSSTPPPPFVPLLSHWKPLDPVVHLNLIRMLGRDDEHRLLALETLLDFADDNDRYLNTQRAHEEADKADETSAKSDGQTVLVTEKEGEEREHSLKPISFVTSILIARHKVPGSPLGPLIMQLLENGLARYDAPLVSRLLTWLVEASEYQQQYFQANSRKHETKFADRSMHLPRGLILRCFQLAGALGNTDIADLTKELCALNDVSLDREEYTQLFIAYCRARDVESVIETLVVAEASEIDFFNPMANEFSPEKVQVKDGDGSIGASRQVIRNSEVHLLGPRYVQTTISKMLRSLDVADRLYFALAEIVRAEMQAPIAALNALIIAQGNLFFLDRAFAVFQEFDHVFNAKPTVHTYHALLGAIAKSRSPRVEYLLQIMSDMDDAGYPPDSGCFSLLLETMMKCKDTDGATGILEHLRTSGTTVTATTAITSAATDITTEAVQQSPTPSQEEVTTVDVSQWPSLRTLRQLAIYYTKRGDAKQCEVVVQMIREKSGNKVLPMFFTQRLEKLVEQGVVSEDTEEEEGYY